jgi:hypothetical protein
MARVKTKGDALLFRLPIHLYDKLCRLAVEQRIRPTILAERIIIEYLEGIDPASTPNTPKPFLGKFDRDRPEPNK